MTSYTEGQPNYTINFSNGYAISWEGDGEGWIEDRTDISVTGNTRIWRYQLNQDTGSEIHNACLKLYMYINNSSGAYVTISPNGQPEDLDGVENRFCWFYIGSNTNLFYYDGRYYSERPTISTSSTWTNVASDENYKSGTLYTLNPETGRVSSSSSGALNFNNNYYQNSYVDPDTQYVRLNGLNSYVYYYAGNFYTEEPQVEEDYDYGTRTCTSSNPEQVERRYYLSGRDIKSKTAMAPHDGYYYAGFGDDYYVATATTGTSKGPIICYAYAPWASSITEISDSDWEYTGVISQIGDDGNVYYMDFGSGSSSQHDVYYEYEGYTYYYSAPSSRYYADDTYTYSSGNTDYRIDFDYGDFNYHQVSKKAYTYSVSSTNLLNGVLETGDDYDTGQWRYTFENGVLTNFEEWGTSHIEQDFSNPTNTSDKYTNFYFWTKYADISTGSSGSPQGNRITIYNNDENGQIEIRFNTSGVLTTVNKRRAPTATYNDRFMFRCNDLWRDGSWSGDGLIFIDGLLWQTSTHLGE